MKTSSERTCVLRAERPHVAGWATWCCCRSHSTCNTCDSCWWSVAHANVPMLREEPSAAEAKVTWPGLEPWIWWLDAGPTSHQWCVTLTSWLYTVPKSEKTLSTVSLFKAITASLRLETQSSGLGLIWDSLVQTQHLKVKSWDFQRLCTTDLQE